MLLEHQSTPDRWLRLRLLGYCVQVWQQWQRQHRDERRLPLLVPLILYQGAWRWVPRFEHLLIDQTELDLERVTRLIGELYRAKGFEEVTKHVEYVLATQPAIQRELFAEALGRNVPGRGGS